MVMEFNHTIPYDSLSHFSNQPLALMCNCTILLYSLKVMLVYN